MCGIAGVVRYDAPGEALEPRARAMQRRLRHRGPDGEGLRALPHAALAATRLALVDLPGGAQPMSDGRYTIVFPDGGGTYRITVRAIGMAPITRDIQRQGDEDRLIADFTMGRTATQLATVQVRATPRADRAWRRWQPAKRIRTSTRSSVPDACGQK